MNRYILALDQGTTSSRAVLLDKEQTIVGVCQKELTQQYTPEGYIEHDPMEIYAGQYSVMMELLAKTGVHPSQITSIGIANQRETTILWDKITGKPIYPAIVWQCRRTAPIVAQLVRDGFDEHIRTHTGLVPDGYFSATKIKWILDRVPEARERAKRGEILFGTVDTWLIWNLTEGCVHATDYTNASRTMLYDIHALCWDDKLLRALDIPPQMLPQVLPSSAEYGHVNIQGVQVPIGGVAGDQQAALFGQCCFSGGQAKNTYGTGCFLLMNTGSKAFASKNGLLTTIAACASDEIQYALEGNVFIGGAVIQWLRDEMRFISESSDAEYYATKVRDSGGVYFVPAFTGLGAPYWDTNARGILIGLSRDTSRNHIIRAAQESIAYQSADLVYAMERDTGMPLRDLRVDGGASRDRFLMQFQADILGIAIRRPATTEATALGCAFLAGLSSGFWGSLEEIQSLWQSGTVFEPCMEQRERERRLADWHRAVERCCGWLQP